MNNSRLQIRKLDAQYLVPAEHPSPAAVKGRLDESFSRHLTRALAGVFSSWFSETDESVWLIRRLEIDAVVNAAWERDQLTRAMTTQIARALGSILQGGEDSTNVLRFPNRAAYLARFLLDLAGGTAWGRWYYESFDGLRLLPTSAALRTAICDRPGTGQEALLRLEDGELKKVLKALTPQDARRTLERLAEDGMTADESGCCRAAWAAWQKVESEADDSTHWWGEALRLYLKATGEDEGAGGRTLKTATLALLRLVHRLRTGSGAADERLLSALTYGQAARLFEAAGAADAETLMPLLRCPPSWVLEVARTIIERRAGREHAGVETAEGPRRTPFGGAFLLLPLIDELPLAEATRGWPHADEAAAVSLVRFLLLIKCCGQERAERAFYDPLLRDLLLIPQGVSAEVISDWQPRVTGEHTRTLLETLARRHEDYGAVGYQLQALASARTRGRRVVLLIDAARGLWVTGCRYTEGRARGPIETFREPLKELERNGGLLLCKEPLSEKLRTEFPGLKVTGFEGRDAEAPAGETDSAARMLARLERLPNDLSYLALPGSLLKLSGRLDLALTVAAQQVLRSFAWRLPGFAESNLPYLASNFLDFAASLEDEAARRVVRVDHPPLHLVLNLTGMTRAAYRLSWLDERPLTLFQEA